MAESEEKLKSLLKKVKKVKVSVTQWFLTLGDPVDFSRLLCPWNSPGKNTHKSG